MSLDSVWKAKFKELWPKSWTVEVPKSARVIIDNWQSCLHQFIRNLQAWDTIEERMLIRMRRLIQTTKAEKYIIVVEDRMNIPRNKLPKHEHTVHPYTSLEEWKGSGYVIGSEMILDADRIIATKFLHPTIFAFFLEKLKWVAKQIYPVELYVDGMLDKYEEYIRTKNPLPAQATTLLLLRPLKTNDITNKLSHAKVEVVEIPDHNHQIGEATLKVWYHVYVNRKSSDIFVKCCNSEFLVIALLNLASCLSLTNPMLSVNLWIDLTPPNYIKKTIVQAPVLDIVLNPHMIDEDERAKQLVEASEIVFVNEIWRDLLVQGKQQQLPHFLTVWCVFMILTGTNYVEGFPRLGVETLLKHLNVYGGYKNLYINGECPVIVEGAIGAANAHLQPITLLLKEHFFLNFMYGIYHQMYIGIPLHGDLSHENPQKKQKTIQEIVPLQLLCDEYITPKLTIDLIRSIIRRTSWTISYWTNGWRWCFQFNPVVLHPESGLPIYGWMTERYTDTITDETKERIVPSAVVHVFSEPPQ